MWIDKLSLEQSVDCLAKELSHSSSWYINCAGYAFGVDGWYTPIKDGEDAWQMYHDAEISGDWKSLELEFVSRILRDFPDWKLSDRPLSEGRQYVAFRIRRVPFYCGFHFMRFDGTMWTQKCGHRRVDKGEWFKIEDVYEPETWGTYDGELFIFEKKS